MNGFEVGLRRTPPPEPLPDEGDAGLVERIRIEIETGGPMTFARFMELALYDPAGGYYRVAVGRAGRTGDFLTAPETHPIFGAALAGQLDEVWRRLGQPPSFVLREYGAGAGTLGLAILRALHGEGPGGSVTASPDLAAAIRYAPIEISEHRRRDLSERLASAGLDHLLASGLAPSTPAVGATIANEFFDALPVHRVELRDGALRELYVGWSGSGFVALAGEPSTPALGQRLAAEGVTLGEGARAEVCLGLDAVLWEAGAGLERGVLIAIDYGHPAAELYAEERAGGTLRAYAGHRVHDDWSRAVGRQDLTAHVDFTAIERAGSAAGLETLGLTSQAEFLVGAGAEEVLDAIRSDPTTTIKDWLAVRSSVARLLDPRAMGGFRVLVMGHGLAATPPLRGLAYRLRQ